MLKALSASDGRSGGDGDDAPGVATLGGLAARLFAAAFLAVYSLVGFGDVAQVAEGVRDVRQTLPRALVVVLVTVPIAYVMVAMAVRDSNTCKALT